MSSLYPPIARGATVSADGSAGLLPAALIADRAKFWRGDGTYQTIAGGGDMLAANNLSDVSSVSSSRTNLGLGTAAVQNVGAFAQVANNLSDLTSASTSRTNLGLGTGSSPTFTSLTLTGSISDASGTIGSRVAEVITQSAHGFSAGQVVYNSNGTWTLAKADANGTSHPLGVIESVTTNTFVLVYQGKVNITGFGLSANTSYYVSDATAGLLTSTAPTSASSFLVSVLRTASVTLGYVINSWATSLQLTNLTSDVTGTLPAANGGTGSSSFTKGDVLVALNSNTLTKVGVGTDGQVFTADSTQTSGIKWATAAGGGNVSNSGTPTSGQIAEWTNATTVQGVSTTGSGNYVRATSATLVTPVLGTPSSGTLTSCTGLPVSTGISGLGTGVATFLATPSSANLIAAVTDETGTGALVFANTPTLVTPVLGTPTSGTLTNCTGLPVSTGVSGLGTGVATFLATPSSANLISAVTDETGTGALVFANTPTLVTPVLGTPTSGTLTNCTGLPVSTGVSGLGTGVATFLATPSGANLASALTTALTVNKGGSGATTLTGVLIGNGTSAFTTVTAPAGTIVGTTDTQTLTNKRNTPRITTIVSSATPTVNTDNCDCVTITAQAAAITSMTTNLTGSPSNFDPLVFRIKDDGTGRAITWGASFASRGATLPTTTTASKVTYVVFSWNSVASTWDCVSTSTEA